tara:strand:+ start:1020 stop:1469 length:450 start_codon:yes stop_codon:yes gene_type:complete
LPDNIVLVTGGFDPIHSGHISYLKEASKLGSKLIVGLNSDEWLVRKKGNYFLPFKERATILKSIKYVNKVISFDDTDDTANKLIGLARTFGKGKVIFANGGDRERNNVPEIDTWGSNPQVEFVFGVGGNKTNSSSDILNNYVQNINDML